MRSSVPSTLAESHPGPHCWWNINILQVVRCTLSSQEENQDYHTLYVICTTILVSSLPVLTFLWRLSDCRLHSTQAAWLILITYFLLKKIICNFKKLFPTKTGLMYDWVISFVKYLEIPERGARSDLSREDGPAGRAIKMTRRKWQRLQGSFRRGESCRVDNPVLSPPARCQASVKTSQL